MKFVKGVLQIRQDLSKALLVLIILIRALIT